MNRNTEILICILLKKIYRYCKWSFFLYKFSDAETKGVSRIGKQNEVDQPTNHRAQHIFRAYSVIPIPCGLKCIEMNWNVFWFAMDSNRLNTTQSTWINVKRTSPYVEKPSMRREKPRVLGRWNLYQAFRQRASALIANTASICRIWITNSTKGTKFFFFFLNA
jgi:hypothetical protein